MLALFGKRALSATLRGVTNDAADASVDVWRTVTLPLLRALSGEEGLELRVVRRGAPPAGGGEVQLRMPVVRQLPPVSMVDEGMVKRVRGVAWATRVSPQTTNRLVDGARGVFNQVHGRGCRRGVGRHQGGARRAAPPAAAFALPPRPSLPALLPCLRPARPYSTRLPAPALARSCWRTSTSSRTTPRAAMRGSRRGMAWRWWRRPPAGG